MCTVRKEEKPKYRYEKCLTSDVKVEKSEKTDQTNIVDTTPPDKHCRVVFWYLIQSEASVCHCTVADTGHVRFKRYWKHTAMFIWSPCTKFEGVRNYASRDC